MFSLKKNFSGVVIALMAAGLFLPHAVQAQMAPVAQVQMAPDAPAQVAPGGSSAAREISMINEEIAVLTAKLNKLKIEAEITAKQKEIAGTAAPLGDGASLTDIQGMAPGGMPQSGASGMNTQIESETPAPAIHSIEGVDGKLYATLIFSGGMNQIVQKGEVIKDGWNVVGLTSSSVTLSRGGKEIRLAFGIPPAAESQRAQGYPGAPVFQ